jgi:hypothetical protein
LTLFYININALSRFAVSFYTTGVPSMQTYFRLPVFSASPQRVSPPAGETQRDGGQLTDPSHIILDKVIKEQIKQLQTQFEQKKISAELLNSQITTSLEAFGLSADFLNSIPESDLIVKASYLYRSIMDKLMKSLEKNTPFYDEITLSKNKDAPNEILIQMGILKNRNNPPVAVPFSPLLQEINSSTPWLTTFQAGLKGQEDPKSASSLEDSIDVTWWVKNFIRHNGELRKPYIKTKAGPLKQLTGPLIKAYHDAGITYHQIAERFGLNQSSISRFMIQNAGTRIGVELEQSIQTKKTLEILLKDHIEEKYFSGDSTPYRVTTLSTDEILALWREQNTPLQENTLSRYLMQMNILTPYSYNNIEKRLIILQTLHDAGHKKGSLANRLKSFVAFCNENNLSFTEGTNRLRLPYRDIENLLKALDIPKPEIKLSLASNNRAAYIKEIIDEYGLEGALEYLQPEHYDTLSNLDFPNREQLITWACNQRRKIKAKIEAQNADKAPTP